MRLLPVLLAGALATGIALALMTLPDPRVGLAALFTSAALAVIGFVRQSAHVVVWAACAGVTASGVALGAHAEGRARHPAAVALVESAAGVVVVSGVLLEDAAAGPGGVRLRLGIKSIDAAPVPPGESAALTVVGALAPETMGEWRAGRAIRAAAALRRPAHYLNPGVPDDRHALARRGLVLVGTVKSGALVEMLAHGSWRQECAADVRAMVRRALSANVRPHDATAAAIATAILIGDRAGLDADLEERLQAAGTYHVIAISGGNIAILSLVLISVARLFRVPPAPGAVLAGALLVAHASLVGAGPSVVRATTMAVICLGLRSMDQSAWNVNALAAAAAGLLLATPLALVEPGFVLSVGATAAIVVLGPRFVPESWTGWGRAIAGVAAASMATELALLPASATLFNRVTVAGLALNLAAVPLMAVVQIAASATVALDAANAGGALAAGALTAWAARGLVATSGLIDWWPWLAIRTPAPSWWISATYLIAVAVVVFGPPVTRAQGRSLWLQRGSVTTAVVVSLWILMAPSTWRWPWRADGLLRVVSLDVGQGDATLVEFPDGRRWLVDAGGLPGSQTFDVGARVVAPALWARGTGRLDALILTHGDPDHVGGAGAVIGDFRPAIFDGVPVPSHVPVRRLMALARSHGRPWTRLVAGQALHVGGVAVRIWHPPLPDWERPRVRNDDSVVFELRYGEVSVVLPGDISAEVERSIAPSIPRARQRVLKAAHHGSASSTSAEWLDALRPDVVIVSCGRENRYGHPAPAVLERVRRQGARVFRTDRDGQVVVETDGRGIRVETYVP
jgi:competence protein ComEC